MALKQSENLEKSSLKRRPFLKLLTNFSIFSTLASILTPIIGYLIPPPSGSASGGGRVPAGTLAELPIGSGKVVPLGNKPVIVVNTGEGIKAFSAMCTHLGCIVVWDPDRQIILCPCHDGFFNAVTGAVISGPPPTSLPTIPVSVEGDEIFIGEV